MKEEELIMPILSVFGIICWNKQEFLLVQEKSDSNRNSDRPPLWKNAGGKIDYNETPREAVEREIEEEVMVKLKAKEMFFTFPKPLCSRPHSIGFFDIDLTDIAKEAFRKNDSQLIEMKWMSAREIEIEIAYKNLLPAHQDAIFAYCKRYHVSLSLPVEEIS